MADKSSERTYISVLVYLSGRELSFVVLILKCLKWLGLGHTEARRWVLNACLPSWGPDPLLHHLLPPSMAISIVE